MKRQGYICASCGKEHDGLPTDWGFKLPDEIFELSFLDKYRRTRANADLCTLDECRYFFRGLLSIPLSYQDGDFSWGVWVEVERGIHDFYMENFHEDSAAGTTSVGRLANLIPGFPELFGYPLHIEFRDSKNRPSFAFPATADHPMANDQRNGIAFERHHEFLELCGHFKE